MPPLSSRGDQLLVLTGCEIQSDSTVSTLDSFIEVGTVVVFHERSAPLGKRNDLVTEFIGECFANLCDSRRLIKIAIPPSSAPFEAEQYSQSCIW
jgi:hypothetical protein